MKKFGTVLSILIMFLMLSQVNAFAQGDSYFYIDDSYDARGGGISLDDVQGDVAVFGDGTVKDIPTGDILPLGTGLAILVAAGAGYLGIKRRKSL